ncbi:MAG: HAMP domain-containing histidine kinase [Archangiaceae bacterium]|nr:HAMP domain-containing histidine kinase [Archangiaceae bacterium]
MTVGSQLTIGFGVVIAATVVTGAVAIGALYRTVVEKDEIARDFAEDLARVENLRYRAEQVVATSRAHPDRAEQANAAFQASWKAVKAESSSELRDLGLVESAWRDYLEAVRAAVATGDDGEVPQARAALERRLDVLVDDERRDWAAAFARSRASARKAGLEVLVTTGVGLLASLVLASVLRRRLDEQFRRKEDAVRARDEVLAVVSHDLRNPLSTILLVSQLAARQSADREAVGKFERIRAAAVRMNRLIDDLIEAARVESGGLTLRTRSCDVTPLINATLRLFEEQAAEKSVKLESELPEKAHAVVDPERLGRVLTNLFGNALKFTPPGGRITVRAIPEASFLSVSVSDSGPGMNPEQLPHLFEKHWQARREGSGLGLGLYIVKSLVEAHGGSISVESAPGAGATFTFRLPASA